MDVDEPLKEADGAERARRKVIRRVLEGPILAPQPPAPATGEAQPQVPDPAGEQPPAPVEEQARPEAP